MATVAAIAAVVGAVAAVAGTVLSSRASSKAARAQRQQRNLEAGKARREQVRQARLARGQVTNTAALTGAGGSSAESSAQGSISSQLVSNLSFLDQSLAFGDKVSAAQSQVNTFGAVSRIGASIFRAAGGAKAIAKGIRPPAPSPSASLPTEGD